MNNFMHCTHVSKQPSGLARVKSKACWNGSSMVSASCSNVRSL